LTIVLVNAKDILADHLLHFYYSKCLEYYMKSIKASSKTIKIHVLCWAIYVVYEILLTAAMKGEFSHFYFYLFFYLLNISLFYVHALYVMPASFRKIPNTLWRLPFMVIIEIGVYVCLSILLSKLLMVLHARSTPLVFNWRFLIAIIWRFILFFLFSSGYYFLVSYLSKRRQEMLKALEVERLKAELVSIERDFLRSQITPHLLFNTLNFIKYASKHKPEEVDNAIIRLSQIMSFAIEKSMNGLILLVEELNQIQNIIQLNQLRFDHKLQVKFHCEVLDETVTVLPIILLTLVENIFKHGILNDPNYPAKIELKSDANALEFCTSNRARKGNFRGSAGLGISNITLRLKNAYAEKATFNYGKEGDFYKTYLRIPLAN